MMWALFELRQSHLLTKWQLFIFSTQIKYINNLKMNAHGKSQANRKQESIQQILSEIPKDMFIDAYKKYCPVLDDRTTARQVQQLCYLHSLAMQLVAIVSADMQRVMIHQQLQKDARLHPAQQINKNMFDQYQYRAKTQVTTRASDRQSKHVVPAQDKYKMLEQEGQNESKGQHIQKNKKQRGLSECDASSYQESSNRQPTQVSRIFQQYNYEGQNKKAQKIQIATKDKPFQKAFAQNQSKKTKPMGFELLQPAENQKNKTVSSREMFLQKERTKMFKNQVPRNGIQFQKTPYLNQFFEEQQTGQELDLSYVSKYQNYNAKKQRNVSKEPKGKSKGRNQQRCQRCQKSMNISNKQFKRNEGLCEDCRCESNRIVSNRMNTNFSQSFGF